MLYEIIKNISKFDSKSKDEFWEKVSSQNIEEFLLDYKIPNTITNSLILDYSDIKNILVEDVTKTDDLDSNLLGNSEIDLVTDILAISYMYGNLA